MAVLKLEPTKAPNLTGTSQILAQAGLSMGRAFESAGSLLSSYQTGREEQADNEVFAEISALNTQEEIDAYFDSGKLAGRPVSSGMMDRLGKLRSGRAALDQTLGATSSAAAREGRAAATEEFRVGSRDEDIARRNLRLAAEEEARTGIPGAVTPGTSASAAIGAAVAPGGGAPTTEAEALAASRAAPLGTTVTGPPQAPLPVSANPAADRIMLARTLQAEAGSEGFQGMVDVGSVIHNRATNGGYGQGIAGVIMQPGQFSAWNAETGYAGGEQGQDMNFEPNAEALKAADAILSGQNVDQTGGALNYFNPAVSQPDWANDSFQARGAHVFGTAGADTRGGPTSAAATIATSALAAPTRESTLFGARPDGSSATLVEPSLPIGAGGPEAASMTATPRGPAAEALIASVTPPAPTAPVVSSTPAQDAYQASLRNSQFLTGDQASTRTANIRTAEAQGVAERKRVRTLEVNELVNAATEKAALDPTTLTEAKVAQIVASIPGLTGVERNEARAEVQRLVGEGGVLEQVLRPDVSRIIDKAAGRVVQSEIAAGRQSIEIMPQHRLYELADKFEVDPMEGLFAHLELMSDDQRPEDFLFFWGEDGRDKNLLRQLINEVAVEAEVTPAQAAAGMAEKFERDPFWFNTNDRRFNKDETIKFLGETMSVEARSRYESQREKVNAREEELLSSTLLLKELMQRRAKMTDKGEITRANGEIKRLQQILRGGNTPREGSLALQKYIGPTGNGMADRLRAVTPGTPAHSAGITLLRGMINNDDTLTSGEKLLLLNTISS